MTACCGPSSLQPRPPRRGAAASRSPQAKDLEHRSQRITGVTFPPPPSRWAAILPTLSPATPKAPSAPSTSPPSASPPPPSPTPTSPPSSAPPTTSPRPSATAPPSSSTSSSPKQPAKPPPTPSPKPPGGSPSTTPPGSAPKAPARTSATARTTRWSTSPGTTPSPTATGPNTRLPTEAEWERAARGGLEGKRFAWGDELCDENGIPRCNIFRGTFPNAPDPGWQVGPVEARSGEPNGFGLYNVCGNVWEWCADAREGGRRALRGGSFLCHDSYCNRYRVAARSANTPDSSTSNIGFRVVAR